MVSLSDSNSLPTLYACGSLVFVNFVDAPDASSKS